MKIYHECIHVILMMKMEQISSQFVCLLKGRFKQPLFLMPTFEYIYIYRHIYAGYMLYIVKAWPNTGKPFKFPTKTWYISQTCHFVTKKNTPRVSPGVHRNTLRRLFLPRFLAGEAPTRGGRGGSGARASVSRHAVTQGNSPQGPMIRYPPLTFFLWVGGWFTSKSDYIF